MTKWWMGVALVAGALVGPAAAPAQYLPQNGPPPLPEPVPEGCQPPPKLGPPVVPGPLGPAQAPRGPCDDLSLPCNNRYAFDECPRSPECAAYFALGAMALQRQRLGHGPVALLDPNNLDTDTVPLRTAPVIQDFNDI